MVYWTSPYRNAGNFINQEPAQDILLAISFFLP
jgi:hypothetical protein